MTVWIPRRMRVARLALAFGVMTHTSTFCLHFRYPFRWYCQCRLAPGVFLSTPYLFVFYRVVSVPSFQNSRDATKFNAAGVLPYRDSLY
jgi:hypothetical protein